MIKGREIISLPVISLKGNKQIGEVKDIVYDCGAGVLGYIIENGGWLKECKVLLHQDVLKIDGEAITIADEALIKKLSAFPEIKEACKKGGDVRGRRVEKQDGSYVGVVQDLVLQDFSGPITGYEISDGIIQDLLDGRSTIPSQEIEIYEDRLVVNREETQ